MTPNSNVLDNASKPKFQQKNKDEAALAAEQDWFERIRPDFTQGNLGFIAGAKKLIDAKRALKKRDGSFPRVVKKLGMDLGKAERLMKIARHPVLGNSAHAPIMPVAWTTLYTLAVLPPALLEQLIADGAIHPDLERQQAEQLVREARGRNDRRGRNRDGDDDHGADGGGGADDNAEGDADDQQPISKNRR
jgi:hypothetical protein